MPPGGGSTGYPTRGGSFPSSGNLGGGGGPHCSCSCMPMDSDPNRFKIEDPSGRDCNNHIYFNSMAECESRLSQIKAGCGTTNTPTPTPTTPSPTPTPGILTIHYMIQ